MDLNLSVFQEPRGVMRIIQFVCAIITFSVTCNFTGFIDFKCEKQFKYEYEYPFNLQLTKELNLGVNTTCHPRVTVIGDFSSDSKFFVCTGVLSMLYCLFIVVVYTKFDELYRTNNQVPLVDFLLSVFLAVLWLSSSASWANALSGLKHITDPSNIEWDNTTPPCTKCPISVGNFSSLNISVILGFLNFFLWAADLWFLYKETTWFQNAKPSAPEDN